MQQFIRTRGVTPCPPRSAAGTDWHKPTASGNPREETAWLVGKTDAKSSEENLAKAKILAMLEDLGGRSRSPVGERTKHQNEAYRWFFRPSDFEDWCDTSGFDADWIREKAREIHENGLPKWRAAPGEGALYKKQKAYRERTKQ